MCICEHSVCVCRCLQRKEEGIGSPGGETAGGCELPDVCAGNRTRVLWMNEGPGSIIEEGVEDCKTQGTRKSTVRYI